MANVIESPEWVPGIYQLETEDPVLGGEDGIDNLQAKQLANRTAYLKQQIEQGDNNLATHLTDMADAHDASAISYAGGSGLSATDVEGAINELTLEKANLASPAFSGTPTVPTAAPGTNTTQAASTAFAKSLVDLAIANLVASSPATLDTLNELAAALGNDANFAATITAQLGLKAPLASPALTGNPTAPTAPPGTNTTQLATMAALQAAIAAVSTNVGKQSAWLPAGAMVPRITNGAAYGLIESAANKILVSTQDFDAATSEYAQFSIRMPKSWNESTVTATFVWSNASGVGDVVWGLQAVAISNDDVLDAAFGAAVTVTDGVTAAGDLMQTAETGAITIAGVPAEGDWVVFQVYRDAANGADTLAVDARLHGILLNYTTNAATDA